MKFNEEVVQRTVDRLLKGDDYREEIVNAISATFLDFAVEFFKNIVDAKISGNEINMEWYKEYFINSEKFPPEERAIYAGVNKKTITNIYGKAPKKVVIDVAKSNFEYLSEMIGQLEDDVANELDVKLSITYRKVTVDLNLTESLIVINVLATKKIQLRGGAWSSIGKTVEKPLIDKLCELAGVPSEYIDNKTFKKDPTKSFDREVDYKLLSKEKKDYRIEVKLMGRGNPESADVIIARESNIFVADTLSEQNCSQLSELGVEYVIMKDNDHNLDDFISILDKLDIPHKQTSEKVQ